MERNIQKKLASLVPPSSVHTLYSLRPPRLRAFDPAALLDGSPDVSFGFGFSAGRRPGPQREVGEKKKTEGWRGGGDGGEKNSNPGCLEREDRLLIRGLSIHGVFYAQSGL